MLRKTSESPPICYFCCTTRLVNSTSYEDTSQSSDIAMPLDQDHFDNSLAAFVIYIFRLMFYIRCSMCVLLFLSRSDKRGRNTMRLTLSLLTHHNHNRTKHTIVPTPPRFHPPHLPNNNTVINVAPSPAPVLLSGGHLRGGWMSPQMLAPSHPVEWHSWGSCGLALPPGRGPNARCGMTAL